MRYPAVIALGLFLATDARAVCTNGSPSIEKEFASSAVVFSGRVTSSRAVPSREGFEAGTIYRLAVREVFRGKPGGTVELFSENSSGRYPMSKRGEYLVFAYRDRGSLSIDNCGNSGKLPASNGVLMQVMTLADAEACAGTGRIGDADALRIALQDMKRRFPTFNPAAVDFSVTEHGCELVVLMSSKDRDSLRLGGGGSLVLSRSGEVKLYFGGM